jgi:hypothetical protein
MGSIWLSGGAKACFVAFTTTAFDWSCAQLKDTAARNIPITMAAKNNNWNRTFLMSVSLY